MDTHTLLPINSLGKEGCSLAEHVQGLDLAVLHC